MSCSHTSDPSLRPPRPSESVYREDCVQCFDSIDDEAGLDVCLHCFNGGCAGDRNHSKLHYTSSSHPLVLNIKRKRKQIDRDEPPAKMTKLSIIAETEADKYNTTTQVNCYECQLQNIDRSEGKLQEVVDGVLQANTYARQQEIKAWELETTACEHTLCLEQQPSRQVASQDLGQCSQCDLKENLWLCLECSALNCGRAQIMGLKGNSHGVAHANQTGHGVSVKLGSITPEGSADVYCYKCDEERVDTELAQHLAHWGINIAERQATEKSLAEMQIEHNLKYDFSMTTKDGKELEPIFGNGFTGLKNIGNSCYLASAVQCVFALPEFQARYYHPDQAPPHSDSPAQDLETQLRKLADGVLSGRYSHPDPSIRSSSETQVQHQRGLNPMMFKSLIGKGHEEFSTMRQCDSFEFLQHLIKHVSMSNLSNAAQDPTSSFKFAMEQRLQCLNCNKVKYKVDDQDNISIPIPARRKPEVNGEANGDASKRPLYEPVRLEECLDIYTAPTMVELNCPSCNSKGFSKTSRFKTFPQNLIINPLRFELVNWVPTKLDVPVEVTNDAINLSRYKATGLQPNEEELPEDAEVGDSSNAFVPNEAALSQLEQTGFPRVRCEKALHATGNADAEAAMNWLIAHMEDPDIDTPVNLGGAPASGGADPEKMSQLAEMGISAPQARKALRECNGDVMRAVDWVFSHPDDQGDFDEDQPTAPAGPKELPGSADASNLELHSIVCHKGASIHAGHYVAFIRKVIPGEVKEKQWVIFNDEAVQKAVNIEEMKATAYVMIFRRL